MRYFSVFYSTSQIRLAQQRSVISGHPIGQYSSSSFLFSHTGILDILRTFQSYFYLIAFASFFFFLFLELLLIDMYMACFFTSFSSFFKCLHLSEALPDNPTLRYLLCHRTLSFSVHLTYSSLKYYHLFIIICELLIMYIIRISPYQILPLIQWTFFFLTCSQLFKYFLIDSSHSINTC